MSHLRMPLRVRPAPAPVPGVRVTPPLVAAAIGIAAQIAYPLSSGSTLDALTLVSVLAFFVAVTTALARAASAPVALRCAAFVLVAGWAIEAVGVSTGLPFGRYEYTSALGGAVASVPLVVPFAWAGMCPIALALGRGLGRGRIATALLGAALLTAWDLFLDPQMVADHRWRWLHPDPHLPGVSGVPLSNFAGWFVVALVLMGVLDRMLPRFETPAVFTVILGWIFASQLLAAVAFFDRPLVGVYGGLAMGALVLPYLRLSRR